MKKRLNVLLAAALVLLGAGCEKVIDFDGEVTQPRLTLSSHAEVGEPLTVYVASSVFFLSDQKYGKALTEGLDTLRGGVRCFVNGETASRAMELQSGRDESSLCYVSAGYIPAPGDRIRLEAEFPGFDPVRAETVVPRVPACELVSVKRVRMDLSGKDWLYDDDTEYYELEITLAVTDDASYDKYYFLQPYSLTFDPWDPEDAYRIPYEFSSNDVVFRETAGADALSLLSDTQYFFSDALIKGQRHEFTITVSMLPPREQVLFFGIQLAAVTESLYWYDVSYAQALSSAGGLFSEGVTLFSNVEGGYGVLDAAASVVLEVDW